MFDTRARLLLTASLLAPIVTLDWQPRQRRGATFRSTARIGTLSNVIIQSVEDPGPPDDPATGLSGWSRAGAGAPDPFPIRLWGFTPNVDGAAWQQLRRAIHHSLLMQAQQQVLLTGKPLHDTLCGLRLTDIDAARRTVALVSGRKSRADTLPDLIHDLHAAA